MRLRPLDPTHRCSTNMFFIARKLRISNVFVQAFESSDRIVVIAIEVANIVKTTYLVTADRALHKIAARLMQSQLLQLLAHIEILAP